MKQMTAIIVIAVVCLIVKWRRMKTEVEIARIRADETVRLIEAVKSIR